MIKKASKALLGTRFEGPAKRLYAAVTGNRNCAYDWQTIAVMRRVLRRDSNGVDVGAFEGGMLRHLCRLAPKGRHVAFEPNPEKAARLQEAFPGVTVFPAAVAAAPGEAAFYRARVHPALSGLRERAEVIGEEGTEKIQVRVETLDRAIPHDLPIAFVKIDVEGGELGVLRGGMETLRTWRPVVVFESGLGGADYFGTRPETVHDLLRDAGLNVSLMDAWLRGGPALERAAFVSEFDGRGNFYFVAHP